jgi:hypothetical protein
MSFDPKGIILHPYESAVNSLHESTIVQDEVVIMYVLE